MNDNKMLFIKGSLFEQTDLLLIESTVLLGYLINFQNINPIFHKEISKSKTISEKEKLKHKIESSNLAANQKNIKKITLKK